MRAQHAAAVEEQEADELAHRGIRDERGLADEVARALEVDGPREPRLERRGARVHVLAVQVHPGLEPQRVARTSPLESGLAWTVDLESPRDFVGKAALVANPTVRQLVGLLLLDGGGVLRAHQAVRTAQGAGEITSGTFSPTMSRSIALARVPAGVATGDVVEVEVRDKRLRARVVKPPFVRNGAVRVSVE